MPAHDVDSANTAGGNHPVAPRKIYIVDAHPRENSFGEEVARRYKIGATEGNHEVRIVALRNLSFDLIARHQPLEPDLLGVEADILWCQHLVIVHPTWWGGAPALLKGMLDRLFRPGFAFEVKPEGGWKGLLGSRTGQILTTMDTPPWIYRCLLMAPGVRSLRDATLKFCGVKPVHVRIFGPIHTSTPEKRNQWLEEAQFLGAFVEREFRTGWKPQLGAWVAAARLHFYPFPVLAAVAGALMASREESALKLPPLVFACAAIVLVEFITVLTNEMHDRKTDELNMHAGPFTGGSRVLVEGRLTAAQFRRARLTAGGALVLLTGTFVMIWPGLPFPGLVTAGLCLGLGYTAPPLKLSYRGLGELDVALTHSFLVILLGCASQLPSIPPHFLQGFPLATFAAVFPSIVLAGFPDFEADSAAAKRTLVVRWGRKRAAWFAMAMVGVAMAAGLAAAEPASTPTLIMLGAILHGCVLCLAITAYLRQGARPGRIDGLLALALSFMVWFVLGALAP